jgi:hypothetical protein
MKELVFDNFQKVWSRLRHFFNFGKNILSRTRSVFSFSGKYAMKDLVYRLPPGEGSQGITEPTYGAIICTIHQLVDQDSQNAK